MTAEDKKSQYDASASATGYLYQCRYALLLGLQAIATRPELLLSIEKFDDISFSDGEGPVAQIQAKHHVSKKGDLTDASEDLWSTLRIWSEQVATDHEKAFQTAFILTTTATAPAGTAASFLRAADRDPDKARTLLLKVAAKSKSKKNAPAYLAFTSLSEFLQQRLLNAVSILDRSANIADVWDELCQAVRLAVPKEHVGQLVERLEGWWFGLMTRILLSGSDVSVLAIDSKLDELREEFSRSRLPVEFASAQPPTSIVADLDKRPFVAQLRRVNVGAQRIEWAIRDYYRASEQRSKWAREKLTLDGEVEQYEQDLIEAWQPRFAAMVDNLPMLCDEKTKTASGQKLYQWAEQDALLPLRSLAQRFLTHGSFHILANRHAVGWHPEFDQPESSTKGVAS
ncbi:ABC-three component system protein [Variovorax sp. KK3]|uniref:ABC-three component system protein n=1 Tax=Variovorax sp. KK3 TaxID=1855728 RepID=UPI00097C6E4C|nr:ABC-three component system protein [Variovorax sp. KK3]